MPQQQQNVIVLVADDEPSTLALVASHVRGKGYNVLEASDGDQAWQLAHEHLPDLVILDVMMPGMSGWEVCRKIREAVSLAHTGVIMLTGIGENLNEMTSPLYGADTYLDKPFEFTALDEKITETLADRSKGAMGRPDPEVAASRESSRPPPPSSRSNGAGSTLVRVDRKAKPAAKKAAAKRKPAPTDAESVETAKPLVKATPRKPLAGARSAKPAAQAASNKTSKGAKPVKAAGPAKAAKASKGLPSRAAGKPLRSGAAKAGRPQVKAPRPAPVKAKAKAKALPKKAVGKLKAAPSRGAAKAAPKKVAPKKVAPKKAAPKKAAARAATPAKAAKKAGARATSKAASKAPAPGRASTASAAKKRPSRPSTAVRATL